MENTWRLNICFSWHVDSRTFEIHCERPAGLQHMHLERGDVAPRNACTAPRNASVLALAPYKGNQRLGIYPACSLRARVYRSPRVESRSARYFGSVGTNTERLRACTIPGKFNSLRADAFSRSCSLRHDVVARCVMSGRLHGRPTASVRRESARDVRFQIFGPHCPSGNGSMCRVHQEVLILSQH